MASEELEELLTEFLQSASTSLQEKTDEIPTTIVRTEEVVEFTRDGAETSQRTACSLREKKKFGHYLALHTEVTESDASSNLLQYVEDASGLELRERYLRKILLDVFGEEGEYLDDWENRVANAVEKLQKDIEEQTPIQLVKHYLRGITLEDPALELVEGIQLRESTPDDFFREVEVDSPSPASMTLGAPPTIAEFEARPQYGRLPAGRARSELLLTTLRLYGVGNVYPAKEIREPRTYLGERADGHPSWNQDTLPKVAVGTDDEQAISNLFRLLKGYFSREEVEFDYPLGAAIDHYESSLETRTRTRESVTFAIIGLESLYTQGRGKVSTHCAFLLGHCHPELQPKEVKITLSEAYDFRSGWVHGGQRKTENKEIQEKLWDYLRLSIVVFGWLIKEDLFSAGKSGRTSNRDVVSNSLIDDHDRESLQTALEEFDVGGFLQFT